MPGWWSETFVVPESVWRERSVGEPSIGTILFAESVLRERIVPAPSVAGPLQLITVTETVFSSRAVNMPSVGLFMVPESVAGSRQVVAPTIVPGPVSVVPSSVIHGRSAGSPVVAPGKVNLAPQSVSAKRSVGSPTVKLSPTYIGVSAGNTSGSGVPSAHNYAVPAGGHLFVAVTVDRTSTSSGVTFGGEAMTLVATGIHNNNSARGQTKVWRYSGPLCDGTARPILPQGSGIAWWIVRAISMASVSEVGTPDVLVGGGTLIQHPVSGSGIHFAGNSQGGAFTTFTNLVNRANTTVSGAKQAISTVPAPATLELTQASSADWASIFIPLS